MSLIPEKPLSFSPQLAATLGLEEAILLQALHEIECHQTAHSNSSWIDISPNYLHQILPFWQLGDIHRLAKKLKDQGVLSLSAPPNDHIALRFSLNTDTQTKPQTAPPQATGKKTMASSWQPELDVIRQLEQYGIPAGFIEAQIPEFTTYWTERGEPHYSWGSKFTKQVVRLWREQQTKTARRRRETAMHNEWQPSSDAVDILTRQAGINANFIEDAIPEFILYWKDKGATSSTWNSQFIQHVRRQWVRYSSAIEHDSEPHIIPNHWQPSHGLYDVLKLANIPEDFAKSQIPAFVLYWQETATPHNSWNTKFLQHIKRQWAYSQTTQADANHGQQQRPNQSVSTRNTSLNQDLTDRSWAS